MLPRLLSPFVLGGLLGLPAAGAALPELLRRLPAEVLQVEVYPRPKALEDRGRALGRKFESTGSWLDLRAETGLEVAHLAGPLVMGEVPGPDGGAIRFVLAPLQDPRGALRTLKAKARSKVWTYSVGEAPKKRDWFGAVQGNLLVLAGSRRVLESALAGDSSAEGLGEGRAFLDAHDSTLLITEAGAARMFEALSKGMQKGSSEPATGPSRLMGRALLGPWVDKAQTSVRRLAFTLDLPPAGGLEVGARILLRPGSSLGTLLGEGASTGHPLGVLPGGAYALALGGQGADAGGFFQTGFLAALDEGKGSLSTELKERWLASREAVGRQIQGASLRLGPPAPSATTLLGNLEALVRVKDAAAFREASLESYRVQGEVLKALGTDAAMAVREGVVPGVTSWTLSLEGGKGADAQVRMVGSLLFGAEGFRLSFGVLDARTLLVVPGGGEALTGAMDRVRQGGTLASSPGIRSVDGHLPPRALLACYLNPKGIRDMAQVLLQAFAGPQAKALPEVAEGAPAALALAWDGEGLTAKAVVLPETLEAFAALIRGAGALLPKGHGPRAVK